MEEYRIYRNFICIDLKSFYASVECHERGLSIYDTPLIVTDISRGEGSITLAMTPYLKEKYKLNSRMRVFELPKNIDIIFAKPRMNLYMQTSAKVVSIYLDFVSQEDLYVYSIDECFLDVTDYLKYYNCTDVELAKMITSQVYKETGLHASVGIGPNMLMAKLALDIDSKKENDSIAKWTYEDLPTKFWPVKPVSKMWGIGKRMEERLGYMGLYSIGDIANSDVNGLIKEFGLIGEEMYYHTHGIDQSNLNDLKDAVHIYEAPKSFGVGQTLYDDYYAHNIKYLIREMIDDQCKRLRAEHYATRVVALQLGFSYQNGGFLNRRRTIPATQDETIIYNTLVDLLDEHYSGQPIRKVMISLGGLIKESEVRYTIFDDVEKLHKTKLLKETMDTLQERFGNSIIMMAKSKSEGTKIQRDKRVGGHNAE